MNVGRSVLAADGSSVGFPPMPTGLLGFIKKSFVPSLFIQWKPSKRGGKIGFPRLTSDSVVIKPLGCQMRGSGFNL